jgi:cell division protease FtsH
MHRGKNLAKSNRAIDIRSYLRWVAIGIIAVSTSACVSTFFPKTDSVASTLTYPQFIAQVKQKQIEKVSLSSARTQALVEAKDGKRTIVKLSPADPQLISILTENTVDIYVIPANTFNK